MPKLLICCVAAMFPLQQRAARALAICSRLVPMRGVNRHQRIMVELAVQILSKAVDLSGKQRADTVPVRLALRCLLPHCQERWPLVMFWDSAAQEDEIGRSQGTTAAFNGIVRQLKKSGAYRGG